MSAEAEIFRILFPPVGAIPVERLETIRPIRSHISKAIALSNGIKTTISPEEHRAITMRVVALRESISSDSRPLTWREIAAQVGNLTPNAAKKRYTEFCRKREIERLRQEAHRAQSILAEHASEAQHKTEGVPLQEAAPEQSGSSQEDGLKTEQVLDREEPRLLAEPNPGPLEESRAIEEKAAPVVTSKEAVPRIGPKIPHSEDEFIVARRSQGARFSTILAELQQKGIECNIDDVTARYYTAASKQAQEAKGKKPHNAPTRSEASAQKKDNQAQEDSVHSPATEAHEIAQEAPAVAHQEAPTASEGSETKQPEPKYISRADLDAKIWALHKEGKTPAEISDLLYAEGYYYGEQRVHRMLLQQGADL